MNGIEPPHFEIGQAVLVDQGLPGEITAVKRGTVRGVLDLPPLNTWLYTVKPEAGGDPQTDVPEYNVVTQADQRENLQSDRSNLPISTTTTATSSTATGIRTPVSGMRSQRPSPLDDSGKGRAF